MKKKCCTVLFAEDDVFDQDLILRAVTRSGKGVKAQFVSSGNEAIDYLKGTGKFGDRERYEYPSFMSTDLKMPQGDGFSVLSFLQRTSELATLPTIVLSSSHDPDDIKQSYLLGASAYLVKPVVFEELMRLLEVLLEFWLNSEAPPADADGRWLPTKHEGKLGARWSEPDPGGGGNGWEGGDAARA